MKLNSFLNHLPSARQQEAQQFLSGDTHLGECIDGSSFPCRVYVGANWSSCWCLGVHQQLVLSPSSPGTKGGGLHFQVHPCDLFYLEIVEQFICLETGDLVLEQLLQAGITLGRRADLWREGEIP